MKIDKLLGRKTDSAIARMAGVSHTAVGKRRRKKGIPPASPQRESRFDWKHESMPR